MAANSPLVDGGWYSEGPRSLGPDVEVAFLPGTTVAEVERFWCDVVVPAGGTHDASGVRVTLTIQDPARPVAVDTTCPLP